MPRKSASQLRQIYRQWVEDQIEEFKDSVSRSDLLRIADEAVADLRINQDGQYQLTEVLLWNAVDRKIFKLLKLPGYRMWTGTQTDSLPGALDEREDGARQNDTQPVR
jgi:hypothetical protein